MTDPQPPRLATGSCIFGHCWTVWEQGTNRVDGGKPIAIQQRYCARCGKAQIEAHRV